MNDQTFDLLIVGGTIIDGERKPGYLADIGVKDGYIAAIGDLKNAQAKERIDATSKVVAPGFIDSHAHDDQAVLSMPDMPFKVSQGVTTVVTGNCGISIAPLMQDAQMPAPLNLLDDGGERHSTFGAYLESLRRAPSAVNVVPLVGHTTLRVMAMDDLNRTANDAEISAMQNLLEEALSAGAFGMSTGPYYPPAAAATTHELVEVSRPLAAKKAMYVTHMRNEADKCVEALEETLEIGREAGVHVMVSHHKLMRKPNFGKSVQTLKRIEEAMACQCVSLDCYPYTASSTMLHLDEERLQGTVIIATSGTHPEFQGRDLQSIAEEWGVSRVKTSKRLQPASAIYHSMDEQDVQRILSFEKTMIGSDGVPSDHRPHPRLWGTFPRVLGHYSRDVGLFPLETAVWKMTGLTAQEFGIEGRGVLAPGMCADITVFDPQIVSDLADYDNPTTPAAGIEAVVVNGTLTYVGGEHLHARAGQVLTPAHKRG